MSKARMAASNGRRESRDPSPALRAQDDNKGAQRAQDDRKVERWDRDYKKRRSGDLPQDDKNRSRQKGNYPPRRHAYAYRSSSRVDRLEEKHPGVRALVVTLLRKRVRQGEIARQVYEQFGVRISTTSLSRFFVARIQPKEDAEDSDFRQAHAQARALIEEMKADPSLDAAKIAEIMLASQIVQDRTKLAEADIMDLYREQRERQKIEIQHRALVLKEQQTRAVLKKLEGSRKPRRSHEEMLKDIRGIYGLSETPPPGEEEHPTTIKDQ